MNGIILIDKPAGWTSHDVVAKVRGRLRGEYKADKKIKVGHSGTLDPMATGVLPICVGNSTKIVDILSNSDKQYRAVMKLGVTTDTQDITGEVLSEADFERDEARIRGVIAGFVGEIEQIPPMYSAIKKDGKKLYELARAGVEIEREARRIWIRDIEILRIDGDLVEVLVTCSKGTYIRTLCHDIGAELGCGATLAELERTKVGSFGIEECRKLEDNFEFMETAVTIGCFDGVHLAHQELVKKVVESSYKSVVFAIESGKEELTAVGEKEEIVRGLGVEVFVSKKLEEMREISAVKFFNRYILGLNSRLVVVGYNFKFGKGREGDLALLQGLCEVEGIELFVLPRFEMGGEAVSSTRIRELVKEGKLVEAEKLLGRKMR